MRPEDLKKESSCEQILKWTEKVLNGGSITEEEARTLIRTAGGMNGVMIGNYLASKGSDPQVSCVEG